MIRTKANDYGWNIRRTFERLYLGQLKNSIKGFKECVASGKDANSVYSQWLEIAESVRDSGTYLDGSGIPTRPLL
jgi:hypothetical protein